MWYIKNTQIQTALKNNYIWKGFKGIKYNVSPTKNTNTKIFFSYPDYLSSAKLHVVFLFSISDRGSQMTPSAM